MRASAASITLRAPERRALEGLVRVGAPRCALRARIVLLVAEGLSNRAAARSLGVSRPTVITWRARYLRGGPAALEREAPRSGRPRRILDDRVAAILRTARETAPLPAARWTVRALAAAHGLSPASVQRIFRAHGVRPTAARIFAPRPDEPLW
jgi:transposase